MQSQGGASGAPGVGQFPSQPPQAGVLGGGFGGNVGGASSDLLRLLQQAGASQLAPGSLNPNIASGGPPQPQLSLQDHLRSMQ